ncbi:MAG: riboflavin synthase [Patescibacteria group bacterium]|nr:riboflavin synthase [Patescibacteria group bacterium]
MFTGIIQKTAEVASVTAMDGMRVVAVTKPAGWKLAKGQSVSIDGVCSTVTRAGAREFSVAYMPETLEKTTMGALARGSIVNLERPLRMSDFVDGHLVLGHVDARARIASVRARGASRELAIELPPALARYAAPRGSIALNGVSLTIARAAGTRVVVALIPFTLAHTNLRKLRKGDSVNVEADVLARYVLHGTVRDTVPAHAKKKLRKETRR